MSQRSVALSAVTIRRSMLGAIALTVAACTDADKTPSGIVAVNAFANLVACTATAPGPSSCPGVDVAISPYAPGAAFGDFQSGPGTGQSSTITITFSVTVSSVTLTAQDPTYAGNEMLAYDANGALLGQVSFAFNNTPGTNNPSTRTITAPGIKSVQLLAPTGEYVAYSGLSFTPAGPCPPVGEGVLDNPAMRAAMRAALNASGANNNTPATRREVGGYIYQKADGTYDLRLSPPDARNTPCLNVPGGPSVQPGETLIGPFHTHPFAGGDVLPTAACKLTPSNATHAYDNVNYGGGSKKDWEFVDPFNLPMYIIDKNEVFRLDGGTSPAQRVNNPNRYTWNNPACTW